MSDDHARSADANNPNNGQLTRRQFLGAAAASWVSATFAGPAMLRAKSPNDQLNVAVIGGGAGGRGFVDAKRVVSEGANIVALCDVSEKRLSKAAKRFSKAETFTDFRKMYDKADSFDAVIVGTPEHTHALATMPALELDKHVYCEKPLTHNVWEARQIRLAARDAKGVTQHGTQIHAGDNYHRVVELIETGAIGPVREAHVWVDRAWGWHPSKEAAEEAGDRFSIIDAPSGSTPKPKGLDWNLWLGSAKQRPFHENYYPGPKWYRFWDFGNGCMSDLGSHWIDLPFWALDLNAPQSIEAFGPSPHPAIVPASMHATYRFPQRGSMPPVSLSWYQGDDKPQLWKDGEIPQWNNGCLFVGDKGMLLTDYRKHVLLPKDQFEDYQGVEPYLKRPSNHYADWVSACKEGGKAACDFEYAGLLTETCHLGNVAYRTGKKLEWDPTQLKAINAPEADQYIHPPYHNGWQLKSKA